MNSFFDFHCHPGLKSGLCRKELAYTAWNPVELSTHISDTILNFIAQVLRPIMDSQASLSYLNDTLYSNVVAVAVVHGFEEAFADNFIIGGQLYKISGLDEGLIRELKRGTVSYYDLLVRDYNFLVASQQGTQPGQIYTALNSSNQVGQDKLGIGISIEGGHCFKGPEYQKFEDNDVWYDFIHQPPKQNEIDHYVNNFRSFKDLIAGNKIEKRHRPIFLTLTHLTAQRTATHCYGAKVKIFEEGPTVLGSSLRFLPYGEGISPIGEALMNDAYAPSRATDEPMLLDLKHMSVFSRQQFYVLRQQLMAAKNWTSLPIIASHMGVTGVRLFGDQQNGGIKYKNSQERHYGVHTEVDLYKKKGLKGTHFYPWSIGLFDEEIENILVSDGLIGVSLDARIVGAELGYTEVFSTLEWQSLIQGETPCAVQWTTNQSPNEFDDPDQRILTTDIKLTEADEVLSDPSHPETRAFLNAQKTDPKTQVDHMANNILHIVAVGRAAGFIGNGHRDVWKFICIGSDLDGIIDPIQQKGNPGLQHTAKSFPTLEQELTESINELMTSDKDDNGINIPGKYGVTDQADLLVKVRAIMFDNGVSFLKKFFNNEFFQ